MTLNSDRVDELAKKIYGYHHLHQQLIKADVIIGLTSHDLRVAEYCAQLYRDGWAPMVLFSGASPGKNPLLMTTWGMPEAEKFREVAIAAGVPQEKILVEAASKNTGENMTFSYKLLVRKHKIPNRIIFAQKPYMERRVWAIFKKLWPDPATQAVVTSPPITYEDYPNADISKENFINIMVGDLQKIIEYPKLGYQIEQDVPPDVRSSYDELVKMGYTKSLIK